MNNFNDSLNNRNRHISNDLQPNIKFPELTQQLYLEPSLDYWFRHNNRRIINPIPSIDNTYEIDPTAPHIRNSPRPITPRPNYNRPAQSPIPHLIRPNLCNSRIGRNNVPTTEDRLADLYRNNTIINNGINNNINNHINNDRISMGHESKFPICMENIFFESKKCC